VNSRSLEVSCIMDIARTAEELHAHVVLEGVEVQPGDTVLLHDAPPAVAQGTRMTCSGRATVVRAGRLGRAWARLGGMFELTSLYEVSFTPGRAAAAPARRTT
jgi:hypothetical protein